MLHYQQVVGSPERYLVLLHGFLGSGRNLHTLAASWARSEPGLHIALVDLPGHGFSSHHPPGRDLGEVAESVLEVVQDFGRGAPVDVVGHSLGGRVGLAMAREAPDRVRSVTLLDIGPGPIESAPEVERLLEILLQAPPGAANRGAMRDFLEARGLSRPMADWLLMNMVSEGTRGVRWRIDREALAEAHARWSPEDLWGVVESPGHLVRLCVRGGRSAFVPDRDARRLEEAGVQVATLPEAGHFLHVEDREGLLGILRGPGAERPPSSSGWSL